jgi:hypothetical protein
VAPRNDFSAAPETIFLLRPKQFLKFAKELGIGAAQR